jgi:hypothetical protein
MGSLSFDAAPVPVRDDIAAALPRVWARIGEPGSWLTGDQRVAIAAEARNVAGCTLCETRKAAVAPYAIDGAHDHLGELPEVWVDVIHRVISDPGRLTESWFGQVTDGGITVKQYVELVGVVVSVVGVDTYCRGIGQPAPAIPAPTPGAPSPDTPDQLNTELAWVPTLDADVEGALQREFYAGAPANIRRALTYVPATARSFWEMANTLYLSGAQMRDFGTEYRAISHAQIEMIAGRVSAINQCVY